MNLKVWIISLLIYFLITVGLIIIFDHIWPENNLMTKITPWFISALITHFVRKFFDFIHSIFNCKTETPYIRIFIKVDHTIRKFTGYGASSGKVIHAGRDKANYEVEIELIITIQNESPFTAYELDVCYVPNDSSRNYTLIDNRDNKLQPLAGDKHFNFTLRIIRQYYDVHASDVDKEVYKIGKGISPLNGSKLNLRYRDSKHKAHIHTELIE